MLSDDEQDRQLDEQARARERALDQHNSGLHDAADCPICQSVNDHSRPRSFQRRRCEEAIEEWDGLDPYRALARSQQTGVPPWEVEAAPQYNEYLMNVLAQIRAESTPGPAPAPRVLVWRPAPDSQRGEPGARVFDDALLARIREDAFQRVVHPERYGILPTPEPRYGRSPLQEALARYRYRPTWQQRRQRAMRALRTMLPRKVVRTWIFWLLLNVAAVVIIALKHPLSFWNTFGLLFYCIGILTLTIWSFVEAYRREGRRND